MNVYGGLVWSIARRMSQNSAETENAVQEISIELWPVASNFDANLSSESTFVTKIARRRLIDRMRKNKTRLERQPLSAEGLERVSELEPTRAELADEAAKAAACFEKLARDTQRTLHMSIHHGYPQLWDRPPGFSTTVHIILEQQVSLASANATFHRLQTKLDGTVTPTGLLELTDSQLKDLGLTRQKILYARSLAEKVLAGDFKFESLSLMPDDLVRCAMTKNKGIGNWTADIYLSECLLRCDILPKGDIGVQEAFRLLKGLDARPTHEELETMTEHWCPWRSVGTRMLWLFYLNRSNSSC